MCLHLLQISLVYINTLMIRLVLSQGEWMKLMKEEVCLALSFASNLGSRSRRDGEEAREMLTSAGLLLFKGSVRDAVAFQKAALAGVSLNKASDQRAKIAWRDYQGIGQEVMK